jgi:hypothetical protein
LFCFVKASSERNCILEQLKKSIPAGQQINDDMLSKVMCMGSLVDTVPLVINTKATDFVGINFYVDDRGKINHPPCVIYATNVARICTNRNCGISLPGSSKGLPMNPRATQIAQLCNRMVSGWYSA